MGATIKAIVDTTEEVRLQVSFGDETARIYLWQIVEESQLLFVYEFAHLHKVVFELLSESDALDA